MTVPRCLGLDIGGANLKAATNEGWSESIAFPLWKFPSQLVERLVQLLQNAPQAERIAVTMTGELADCFTSKREGVEFIVDAVETAIKTTNRQVGSTDFPRGCFYLTDGNWSDAASAKSKWRRAAASNWHAMAKWIASIAPRVGPSDFGILLDLGSTTCDVTPFADGSVLAKGDSDLSRIVASELVYTGVERSPVCAVLSSARLDGLDIGLAQEFFASMQDVYVLLGHLPEDKQDRTTADGQPRTLDFAKRRLARLLCSDVDEVPIDWLISLAEQAKAAQLASLTSKAISMHSRFTQSIAAEPTRSDCPGTWWICGQGEFLLRELLVSIQTDWLIESVSDRYATGPSRCGPAYAVACLAAQDIEKS